MRVGGWPWVNSPMTVESIIQKHDPSAFRVADHRYPPGASFSAITRAVTWYVLAGSCKLTRDGDIFITAGQVAELDAGTYTVTILGDFELHVVHVWDLRPFQN
jgi:hypothetical protein